MKKNYLGIIFTTFAFSLLCENKVQAAVESLGDRASITIPNKWRIGEKTASTLTATNPSGSVEIIISHFVPDVKNSTPGGTYDSWNKILEWYLNSFEMDDLKSFTEYGYPITEISDSTFSAGTTSSFDCYVGKNTREFYFFNDPSIYGCILTTCYFFDGAMGYLVKNYTYSWASSIESTEAIQAINSLKSTNINSPLSDSDGDGVNNFDEIILYGTNPNSADIPQGTIYQGPTITSDLSNISVPVSQSIIPYAVSTNFKANVFKVSGLPKGLIMNAKSGVITGKPTEKGKYTVRMTASRKKNNVVTDTVMTSKSVIVY